MTADTFGSPRPSLHRDTGEQLSDVVCSAPLLIFALDAAGVIRLSTGGALAALGVTPGELVGTNVFDIYTEDMPFNDHFRRALAGERFRIVSEFADRVYEFRYSPALERGRQVGAYGIGVDITDRVEMQRSLHEFAAVDAVTELSSRQSASAEISRYLLTSTPIDILLVDLDEFKDVNDTHGHALGDLVLRQLGRRLRGLAPDGAIVGRMGGDELIVVLPDTQGAEAVAHFAEQILDAIARPLRIDIPTVGQPDVIDVTITASIGIVGAPRDGTSATLLLAHADTAMYTAKRSGGATYRFYDGSSDDAPRRLTVATRLRRAVARHEIHPVFQPLYRLADNEIAGFEALARWHDPELGHVPPSEFIALAEKSPLIEQLFDSVLEQSLTAAAGWNRGLGINVAARQLRDRRLFDRIAAAAGQAGFPLQRLCVELTETAMMDDVDTTHRTLASLSEAGVQIYIDDFGVGYSNAARLADLATAGMLTGIKVDRRFIADPAQPRMAALLQLFQHMSDTFGVDILLEGIETAEHLRVARDLGYQLGQGWYLGRPLSAEAAAALLRPPDTR